jgi:DnaJ-class molecular chaperone
MIKVTEKRIKCNLCDGRKRILTSIHKKSVINTKNWKHCPLCNGKGYLAIITQEIVQ